MATIQNTAPSLASLGIQSPGDKPKAAVDEAADRFLTLLVTQMRNQDPLNPLDNAQVTTQLAQLNTVTGINKLNDTLAGLASSFTASQLLQGAGMVGHSVLVGGTQIELAGGQALFGAELPQSVERLSVEITNSAGVVVHRAEAGPQAAGIIGLNWDGALDAGGSAPAGRYRFALTGVAAGKNVEVKPLSLEKVQSVTAAADGLRLNLPLSGAVPLSGVRQVF